MPTYLNAMDPVERDIITRANVLYNGTRIIYAYNSGKADDIDVNVTIAELERYGLTPWHVALVFQEYHQESKGLELDGKAYRRLKQPTVPTPQEKKAQYYTQYMLKLHLRDMETKYTHDYNDKKLRHERIVADRAVQYWLEDTGQVKPWPKQRVLPSQRKRSDLIVDQIIALFFG